MAKRDTAGTEDNKLRRGEEQDTSTQPEHDTIDNKERISRSTVYNIRLPREELAALELEAEEEGLTVAEYLRKSAALHPLSSVLAQPQFNLSVSTPYFQYGSLVTWSESQCQSQIHITNSLFTSSGILPRLT
jgi:hypothetical protein